ncbi:hypothetical protein RRG08_052386 [Elysia crispata]|uniref:BTB domain-containing protein n=1 Tax=Elysia crispata TaxID=231223 RepID=A0AAE1B0X8_9GAST|nr:hypothetical protein RRG08_052386 [Elysia crispata]
MRCWRKKEGRSTERGTCTEPSLALLLHKALVQDREDQQFSDFSVTVDEVEFKCHRLVLSTRSGFFQSLLTSGMIETTEGKATLQSISSDVFAIVLKWMYEGEANLSEENVIDVLFAADQLDVQSLVSQCQYLLMQNLSLENCIRFYHTSKVFNHKELEEKSRKILLENFDCVCISDEFYTLNTDEIMSLVSDPRLNTRSEDVVMESILRWVRSDADQQTTMLMLCVAGGRRKVVRISTELRQQVLGSCMIGSRLARLINLQAQQSWLLQELASIINTAIGQAKRH